MTPRKGAAHCLPTRSLRVSVRGQRQWGYLEMGSGMQFVPATTLGLDTEGMLGELDRMMREVPRGKQEA